MSLGFVSVRQRYGRVEVVRDVTLQIPTAELHVLLGASGSGKTTLLRVAAGLERAFEGQVRVGDRVVDGGGVFVPPEARGVGYVFQDYALFPHMRVGANVAFGLRGPASERRARAATLLGDVGLGDRADDWPHTLSGGQQQRVALARALAVEPAVMLLDEPFSGLDVALRGEVRRHTRELLTARGVTALMVTHDPEEAVAIGERISVLRQGQIEQTGTPDELYLRPATAEVARFLGPTTQLRARADGHVADTPLGRLPTPHSGPVEVLIRREALRCQPVAANAADLPDKQPLATVVAHRRVGPAFAVELLVAGHPVEALHDSTHGRPPAPGSQVTLHLDPSLAFVFPAT